MEVAKAPVKVDVVMVFVLVIASALTGLAVDSCDTIQHAAIARAMGHADVAQAILMRP